ncbi:MAG: zinc ribbon domain-containing protein [Candidatus Anammoximicrobium sp.]|nr:zinc ribbon domain-containing protein [Candidatus Anammoximicrobium sp.]
MSRWRSDDKGWDDAWESDGDPDSGDWPDADDDEPTVPCPYCGREIHEESLRCPYCESYLSDVDAPRPKPWWLVVGVAAGLYAVYRWVVSWSGAGP